MAKGFQTFSWKGIPRQSSFRSRKQAWKAKSLSTPVFFYPISVQMAYFWVLSNGVPRASFAAWSSRIFSPREREHVSRRTSGTRWMFLCAKRAWAASPERRAAWKLPTNWDWHTAIWMDKRKLFSLNGWGWGERGTEKSVKGRIRKIPSESGIRLWRNFFVMADDLVRRFISSA